MTDASAECCDLCLFPRANDVEAARNSPIKTSRGSRDPSPASRCSVYSCLSPEFWNILVSYREMNLTSSMASFSPALLITQQAL